MLRGLIKIGAVYAAYQLAQKYLAKQPSTATIATHRSAARGAETVGTDGAKKSGRTSAKA